jgi:hypothetical protein
MMVMMMMMMMIIIMTVTIAQNQELQTKCHAIKYCKQKQIAYADSVNDMMRFRSHYISMPNTGKRRLSKKI